MEALTSKIIRTSLSEILGTVLVVVAAIALLEFILYYLLKKRLNWQFSLPIMLVTPAFIGLMMLVMYPIIYNVVLAFSNMSLRRFTVERGLTYGFLEAWNNLKIVFSEPVLKQQTFFPVLFRTFLWTFIQVFFHVVWDTIFVFVNLINRFLPFKWKFNVSS